MSGGEEKKAGQRETSREAAASAADRTGDIIAQVCYNERPAECKRMYRVVQKSGTPVLILR